MHRGARSVWSWPFPGSKVIYTNFIFTAQRLKVQSIPIKLNWLKTEKTFLMNSKIYQCVCPISDMQASVVLTKSLLWTGWLSLAVRNLHHRWFQIISVYVSLINNITYGSETVSDVLSRMVLSVAVILWWGTARLSHCCRREAPKWMDSSALPSPAWRVALLHRPQDLDLIFGLVSFVSK